MESNGGAPVAIMTYNILVGGRDMPGAPGRLAQIEAVIGDVRPDIVGVEEANNPQALQALARRLGMQAVVAEAPSGFHVGLLSRWPIRAWHNHQRPIFQKTLLEAEIDVPGESQPWHIFVGHLTADFSKGRAAELHRLAEIRTILECMRPVREQGLPHLLMGDFNTLAPGERFDLVRLIARIVDLDDQYRAQGAPVPGQPHLRGVVPQSLQPFMPLARRLPTTPWLASAATFAAHLLIPRLVYPELVHAGYIDCLRQSLGAPQLVPPTCPLPTPAGRIDYIWAAPSLAERLVGCEVVTDAPGRPVLQASDHAPVVARFVPIQLPSPSTHTDASLAGISAP